MIDWEDTSGSSSEDEREEYNLSKAVYSMRSKMQSSGRESVRGLQIAIQEGWLVQRARDMCSFAHDRYRQAAEAEAASLPEGTIAKMSFRVS
jgi:hypothetical protein